MIINKKEKINKNKLEKNIEENWFVYMIRCEDLSLYTGITKNVEKRFNDHKEGRGAKYTKSRKPKKIEKIFTTNSRSSASKLEYFIKKFPKSKKEFFISSEENKKYFINLAKKELNIEIF